MQPGQMAYDRGITVFSPDGRLFQVEYAREAVKKGSTTIGLKYKGGVALIVDKRSNSKLLEPKSTEKIHDIDDFIGCATSGLVADARVLVDEARKNAQVHRVNYGENIGVMAITKVYSVWVIGLRPQAELHPVWWSAPLRNRTSGRRNR